ncbi:MAG: single-stranded DNA-binding protein [Acidimicrobiales bacterium]
MSTVALPPTNHVLLAGTLSSDPVRRELPSGDVWWTYEVTIRDETRTTESVPVVLVGGRPPRLGSGDPIVVVGRVRRRFFRAGGATSSRTEVVAHRVVRATSTGAVQRVVDDAAEFVRSLPRGEGRPVGSASRRG